MKRIKKLSWIVVLLSVVFLIMSCSSKSDNTADAASEAKTETEQQIYNWRSISCFPKGSNAYVSDEHFANLVREMSQGQLNITLYGAGELASANEVLEMVSSGTVEMGGDWPGYWAGKNPAFELLASSFSGFNAADFLIWIYQADGLEEYQKLYGEYNCKYFPHLTHNMESGIRSNFPVNSLHDLAGKKVRMGGLIPGKVLQSFDITPMSIAPAEIYEAVRRGTLDAFEYSIPTFDKEFSVEEISKYWLTPGFHSTSSVDGLMINLDAWNSLPEHIQVIVEQAARATILWGFTRTSYSDAEATKYFTDEGIQTTVLPANELDQVNEIKNRVQSEIAAENPDYARILKSQIDYMRTMAPYRDALGVFGFGNNPSSYPTVE